MPEGPYLVIISLMSGSYSGGSISVRERRDEAGAGGTYGAEELNYILVNRM